MSNLTDDRLFQWWYANKFDRFCEYMHAWHKPFNNRPEEHDKVEVRIDRAISYIDMDDQRKNGGGFIRQYLLIKYAMEFVEYITESYWQLEQELET